MKNQRLVKGSDDDGNKQLYFCSSGSKENNKTQQRCESSYNMLWRASNDVREESP